VISQQDKVKAKALPSTRIEKKNKTTPQGIKTTHHPLSRNHRTRAAGNTTYPYLV
jgi:hypothetical protein